MNDAGIPMIDIRYGHFLEPMFDTYSKQNISTAVIPKNEQVAESIEYQKAQWREDENVILNALLNVTGLTFLEPIIPVYIVPSYEGAFSDPIVISSLQVERFTDVLTHELIHRLGDYNQEHISMRDIGRKLYENVTNVTVRDHILVHSIHQYLYLEILKSPRRLADDINSSDGAYKEAWDFVQKQGYETIITKYKEQL